jgi:hypothetical protein
MEFNESTSKTERHDLKKQEEEILRFYLKQILTNSQLLTYMKDRIKLILQNQNNDSDENMKKNRLNAVTTQLVNQVISENLLNVEIYNATEFDNSLSKTDLTGQKEDILRFYLEQILTNSELLTYMENHIKYILRNGENSENIQGNLINSVIETINDTENSNEFKEDITSLNEKYHINVVTPKNRSCTIHYLEPKITQINTLQDNSTIDLNTAVLDISHFKIKCTITTNYSHISLCFQEPVKEQIIKSFPSGFSIRQYTRSFNLPYTAMSGIFQRNTDHYILLDTLEGIFSPSNKSTKDNYSPLFPTMTDHQWSILKNKLNNIKTILKKEYEEKYR